MPGDLVILDNVAMELFCNDDYMVVFESLPAKFLITTTDMSIKECLNSPETIDVSSNDLFLLKKNRA